MVSCYCMTPFSRVLLLVTASHKDRNRKMELTNAELKIIMNALFDKIGDDDLPTDDMKSVMKLHNKIGDYLMGTGK